MTVELISVGTEILLGNIVNTNSYYLSKKCAELGLELYYQISVGDNENRLCDALKTALLRSDIVILTGGLGPTLDDMTKEAVAKTFGKELIMDQVSKERILSYFNFKTEMESSKALGIHKITDNNWRQALKIEDSIVVENNNGTAPGYILEADYPMDEDTNIARTSKRVILLPGPPSEMIPMFEQSIYPYLMKLQNKVLVSAMVKICGIGESKAETDILDLIHSQKNPTIAPYAKNGEVHFRITALSDCKEQAQRLLAPVIDELYRRFSDHIYTIQEAESLEEVVVKQLMKQGLTVTCAESCTGGMLTSTLVNVPGVSEVLKTGLITYSNEAKQTYLGVKESTLKEYGAVSEQTAREMAAGAALMTGSDTALAITGIAGPDGGTEQKPVGLVYISCYIKGNTVVKEYYMKGNRDKIRERSVIYALDLLRRSLI